MLQEPGREPDSPPQLQVDQRHRMTHHRNPVGTPGGGGAMGGSMVSLHVQNPRVPEALTLGGSMVPLIVQKPKVPEAKTLGVTELTLKRKLI